MGLEQYVITFVTFVNNIVIPFLMGIAFLFFVFNAFRFFIVGGANADGREKARSLAIYGLLAFVLILVFWGIVNLLSNSLGLTRLGQTTARCFDYDPDCNISPAVQTNNGSNVQAPNYAGNQAADPYAPIGMNTDGFGNDFSPNMQTPSQIQPGPNTGNPGAQPVAPSQPAGVAEFESLISTETAIRPAADDFIRRDAPDLFGRHTADITDDLFADLPDPDRDTVNFSDIDRAQATQRLAITGTITDDASLLYLSQLEDYYEAITPGYYQDRVGPLVSDITKDVPPNVQTNFDQTTMLIEEELTTYYSSVGLGLSSAEVSQSVAADLQTLSVGSTDDRLAALENLYDQNILRDPTNVIYDQFSEDLNVERIYAGNRPDY